MKQHLLMCLALLSWTVFAQEASNERLERREVDAPVDQAEADRAFHTFVVPNLRNWDLDDLCVIWGKLLRGEPTGAAPASAQPNLWQEIRRRDFRPSKNMTAEEAIKVGSDICQVLASWGYPEHRNATITAAGSSAQWVYGSGQYVYTSPKGRVTAIQQSR